MVAAAAVVDMAYNDQWQQCGLPQSPRGRHSRLRGSAEADPIAFLRRSKTLRDQIVEQESCKERTRSKARRQNHRCCYNSRSVDIKAVDEATFRSVFEWSLMPQPTLRSSLTVEEVLSLLELGQTYQIRALRNQTLTRLQERFGAGDWKLSPEILRRIWAMAGDDGTQPLVLLVSFMLGSIGKDGQEKAWSEVMEAHPGLYKLHSEACLYQWGRLTLLQWDPCDLHDHEDRATEEDVKGSQATRTGCPFLNSDCWPVDMGDEDGGVSDNLRADDEGSKEEWQGVIAYDGCSTWIA